MSDLAADHKVGMILIEFGVRGGPSLWAKVKDTVDTRASRLTVPQTSFEHIMQAVLKKEGKVTNSCQKPMSCIRREGSIMVTELVLDITFEGIEVLCKVNFYPQQPDQL